MRLVDLPEEALFLAMHHPSAIGTRALLTSLTGKICPEIATTNDIESFIDDVAYAKPEIRTIFHKPENQNTTANRPVRERPNRRTHPDEEEITVVVDYRRLAYGNQSYSEIEYADRVGFDIPISVVAEGEDAIWEYIVEQCDPWDNVDYDSFETGDTYREGDQNEEHTFHGDIEAICEAAEERLRLQNENN